MSVQGCLIPDFDLVPHRNLDTGVNRYIVQSEVEGGVYLPGLPVGSCLLLATKNHQYLLQYQGHGRALICGHPRLCPEPVEVAVCGSNWGGSLLKSGFVGRGMRLEFHHPEHKMVTTSPIVSIEQR